MYVYMHVPWWSWLVFGQREGLGSLMLPPQYLQKEGEGERERERGRERERSPHSQEG